MDFLELLFKSGASVAAPSSATPTPGGSGGGGAAAGTGSPKAGHKYISRKWNGSSWDYEYKGEAAQHHGPAALTENDHTLEIPDSVGAGTHEKAKAGDKAALKDVYKQSKKHATDLPSNKGVPQIGKHPVTGEPIKYSIISQKNSKGEEGHRIRVFMSKKDAQGNPMSGKDGQPVFETKASHTASDWDKVQLWHKMAQHMEEIKGPDGTTHYTIMPTGDDVDEDGNIVPSTEGLNYKIKVADHAPERHMADKRGEIRVADKAAAKARFAAMKDGHAKMQQNAGKQGAAQHLASGKTATEVLEGSHLPIKMNATGGRVKNVFANDQEKDAFIQQLANEKAGAIQDYLEKKGHPLDGDLENVAADKDSVLYRTLNSVAENYQHKDGRSVDAHIFGNLRLMNQHGHHTRDPKTGKRVFNPGVAGAAVSMDSAAVEGSTNTTEAAASGVKTKKQGGGSAAAAQVEDDFADMIDSGADMFNTYKDLQTHKLDKLAAAHLGNADIQRLVSGLKTRMSGSRSVEDFLGASEEYLTKEGAAGHAEHFLVHPRELDDSPDEEDDADNMGKSWNFNNPLIADFCKSYAESYAALRITLEEDLIKSSMPPQDSYSHKDGSLYPRFYYKDSRGNQIRYTNAPDGTDDFSGQFGPVGRHPGEPDMAKNPEFFTPDGRKLSRAPHPQAPVEWNQSYHPEDSKNLWACRWVNPATGQHEYSYIEADLLNSDKLQVHRQNVVVDARLPVMRKYTAALFESNNVKDRVTGLMLSLLDQGRFRIRELVGLSVGDVVNQGDSVQIGKRKIVPDNAVRNVLAVITTGRPPHEPLFAVPRVGADGGIDYSKMRRLGPHYIVNILEEIGIPLQALATYHASQTYSIEIQRILEQHNTSYKAAHTFAMLEVATEMGHNLDFVEDYETALELLANSVVDPIVINVIKQNVGTMGLGTGEDYLQRPVHESVYTVFGQLADLSPEEKLFSQWIQTAAVHNYIN